MQGPRYQGSASALKVLVMHWQNEGRITAKNIENSYVKIAQSGDLTPETISRYLTRSNSTPTDRHFDLLQKTVRQLVEDHQLTLPAFLQEAGAIAGIAVVGAIAPRGSPVEEIPPYANADELRRLMGDLEDLTTLVERYGGCWRTFRLSSRPGSTNPGAERVSVGFLNIKPLHVMQARGLDTPEFSFYQRGDADDDFLSFGGSSISNTYGAMLVSGQFITLLGDRPIPAGGIGYTGVMTWPDTQFLSDQEKIFTGISCLPNSEGHRMVGAYFCGYFIASSDKLSEDQYVEIRRRELDTIGTKDWAQLQSEIGSEALKMRITQMIQRSRTDGVFQV